MNVVRGGGGGGCFVLAAYYNKKKFFLHLKKKKQQKNPLFLKNLICWGGGGGDVHCNLAVLRYNKFLYPEENKHSHSDTSNIQTVKLSSFILQLVQGTFDRPIKFRVHR